MDTQTEQTIKKKLTQVSKERGLPLAEIWQNLLLERFLARLSASSYQNHFVLKGGVLLARYINLGRETKDLDFSIFQMNGSQESLEKALSEIISIDLQDGFKFTSFKVIEAGRPGESYAGMTIRIEASFGKTTSSIFVDLTFGDEMEILHKNLSLLESQKGGPLFESNITLSCYPLSFIFAEKLETIVVRGAENSRMKDYHDLYTIVTENPSIDKKELLSAITLVFKHRKTELHLPISFSDEALELLEIMWGRYLKSLPKSLKLPKGINEVLGVINGFVV